MEWGAKSRIYIRHWDIEKHCSIVRKCNFRLRIYSLLLTPHQRNKWQFNMEWGAKSRLYVRHWDCAKKTFVKKPF